MLRSLQLGSYINETCSLARLGKQHSMQYIVMPGINMVEVLENACTFYVNP